MSKRNYKSTRIEMEGRIFLIEFWDEPLSRIDLHYVCVSEIILKEVKPFWSPRKTVMREIKHAIHKTWGATNRVEWAMNQIKGYLRQEKERLADQQQIDDFCNKEKQNEHG